MKTSGKATSNIGRDQAPAFIQDAAHTIERSQLRTLFEDGLRDLYQVEKSLLTVLPRMAANASSEKLIQAIGRHLEETREHVYKLEQIFGITGKKARVKKSPGMDGIIKENHEIMKTTDAGIMRDAAIIASAQAIEHYEISSYGTLRTYAEMLGLDHISVKIQDILDEEKRADETLTDIAYTINREAASR